MKFRLSGCSHHDVSIDVRQTLAFSPQQIPDALSQLAVRFPAAEAVILSTCNRVEIYTASEEAAGCPTHDEIGQFLADFHGIDESTFFDDLHEESGPSAISHLFTVAASLDSMVVGEAQIIGQVRQAYELARKADVAGPLTHVAFQSAMRVAKRVATETKINEKRVSIPSVAVLDLAREFFDRFDDKQVLLIGAGEMGRDSLVYLKDLGVNRIDIVNRSQTRADELAAELGGVTNTWDNLPGCLERADLVISTTGASEPIMTRSAFEPIERARNEKPLFILDLALPRDFDTAIETCAGVYLYCIDDLQKACDANRVAREKEWPKATAIIEEESSKFLTELNHRATGPTIKLLKERADELQADELTRLMNKLDHLDDRSREEIRYSFSRLVNKILHPPLESLRDEAATGTPHGLLDALKRLFHLHD